MRTLRHFNIPRLLQLTSYYEDRTFLHTLQLYRQSYSSIVDTLGPNLHVDESVALQSSTNAIIVEVHVAVMLHLMGGSSYL